MAHIPEYRIVLLGARIKSGKYSSICFLSIATFGVINVNLCLTTCTSTAIAQVFLGHGNGMGSYTWHQ